MWAAHSDSAGVITGWEERGPSWRGFATSGTKELFRRGSADSLRICVTEAAVDAMSLAALEELRDDTLYISTGGGWAPASEMAIRALAGRPNTVVVAATDNNRQGEVYAVGSRRSRTKPTLVSCGRSRAPTIGTRISAPPESKVHRKAIRHGPVLYVLRAKANECEE